MKVVILCGGLGTRLKEETEFRPKPMVNIGDRPILWHIMKVYSYYGFNDFVLCLGYKGEIIKEYFYHYELINSDISIKLGQPREIKFLESHSENNWTVTLVDTGKNTLKGARLKKVQKYIDGDIFLTTYGDGLADIDINELIEFHKSHGKLATVTGVSPTSRFGELKIDGNSVKEFFEKPENNSSFINGGFFVFDKKIFDYLTLDENCDLETQALTKLAQEGELMVYKHHKNWICMDTLRDNEFLNKMWNENKAFWKNW